MKAVGYVKELFYGFFVEFICQYWIVHFLTFYCSSLRNEQVFKSLVLQNFASLIYFISWLKLVGKFKIRNSAITNIEGKD